MGSRGYKGTFKGDLQREEIGLVPSFASLCYIKRAQELVVIQYVLFVPVSQYWKHASAGR